MSNWKITIPISRAFEEDGRLYIEGEASGPERDTHNTEMSQEAVFDFARQIQDRVDAGDPLPFMDSHLKRGIATQLGWVISGFITALDHLFVRVELDSLNPLAVFLHNDVKRGKKMGMSIAGSVNRNDVVAMKDEQGNKFMRFMRVLLGEISATTSPSWVPSLGTVLARSLDAEGDLSMSEELDEQVAQVENSETTTADESEQTAEPEANEQQTETAERTEETEETPETPAEETAEERSETPADDDDEAEEEETTTEERGGVPGRLSSKDRAAFKTLFAQLGVLLTSAGVLDEGPAEATTVADSPASPEAVANSDEPEEEEAPETTSVESSADASEKGDEPAVEVITREMLDRAIATAVAPLVEKIDAQTKYIEQLENLPAGKLPPGVQRAKFETPPEKDDELERMTPEERSAFALRQIYADSPYPLG